MLYGSSDLAWLNQMIYSFHVPLFFILSGYVYTQKETMSTGRFVRKKVLRLIVPATIFVLACAPLKVLLHADVPWGQFLQQLLFFDGTIAYNLPAWFFYVLFEVYLMIWIFRKNKNFILEIALCAGSFLLGYIVYRTQVFLPFGLDKALLAFGFFCVGKISREKNVLSAFKKGHACVFAILCIVVSLCFNPKVSMYEMSLGYYWCFVLTGLLGSIALMVFARALPGKKTFFAWLNSNSVLIVCTHYIYVSVLKLFCEALGIWGTRTFDFIIIPNILVLFALYYPACKFVNKYLPVLNGRKRLL